MKKYEAEFKTKFEMESDGTETLEVMEDRAWDILTSGRDGLEWDLDVYEKE